MSEADLPRVRRKKASPSEAGSPAERVGWMMGKLEGIEDRLDQGDQQRQRMEAKIDDMPDIIRTIVREAVAPLSSLAHDNAARITALEHIDSVKTTIISMRTKIFGSLFALGGLAGTLTTIWGAFRLHK